MQMRDRISAFLEEKQGLSVNSKQSYKYDLEQFLDLVGERISETSLKIYQAQLTNLKISAQKRKISACNQFLYFLYQKGEVDSFYRLELAKQAEKKTEKPEILDLDSFSKSRFHQSTTWDHQRMSLCSCGDWWQLFQSGLFDTRPWGVSGLVQGV